MDQFYPTGPNGLAVFLFVTVALAGAAAWATGRAVAMTWKPYWQLALYVILLTLAARFLHYALFKQPFLTVQNVIVDFLVLLVISLVGHRLYRAFQMTRQYPWLYRQTHPFGWSAKSNDGSGTGGAS